MIAQSFSSCIKNANSIKIIDYIKVPLAWQKDKNGIVHVRLLSMIVPMLEHCTWSN